MSANPEILHTSDIPEAESEVQDALIARLSKEQPKPKRGSRRNVRKESRSKVDPKISGLEPIAVSAPRTNALKVPRNMLKSQGVNWREARDYAAMHVFECMDFLMAVVRDPLSKTNDRTTAACELLDRGMGKAVMMAALELNGQGDGDGAPAQSQVLIIGDQKVVF